jgi:hypothetical protein
VLLFLSFSVSRSLVTFSFSCLLLLMLLFLCSSFSCYFLSLLLCCAFSCYFFSPSLLLFLSSLFLSYFVFSSSNISELTRTLKILPRVS